MEFLRTVLLLLAVLSSMPLRNASAQNFSLGSQNVSRATMTPPLTERNIMIEKWENFDRNMKQLASEGIKTLLPRVLQRYEKMRSNLSSACIGNALRLLAGLKESKVWAFSFFDASGKALDGLLSGSLASLGEYDQCVNTEAINEKRGRNYGKIIFRGKYCALDIKPPLPPKKPYYKIDEVIDELKNFSRKGTIAAEAAKSAHFFYFLAIRIGLCVPSGCSEQDISAIAQTVVQQSGWSAAVKRCEVKQKPVITPVMMFVMAVYGFLALLLVIGTTVDLIYYFKEQKIKIYGTRLKILTSFSLVSNFRRLVNTRSTNESLGCLNGVRFLSITWIILGHTYMTINFQIFRGLKIVATYQRDFAFQAVVNATIAVDTFFFMGGLLVCYVTIKMVKERKKPFNLTLYIFHRIWRIMPAYVLVVFLMAFAPIAGTGPVWHDTLDRDINNCYSNWWTNLVFLNNYLHAENICLTHSWYVAADMQLYLFSLVILLPLIRWPKVGICLAVLFAIISMIVTSWITYSKGFPPAMLFVHPDADQRIKYLANVYFKPYPHAGSYFVGILAGYLLATKPNMRFPRVGLIFGWCAAAVCNLSVLYGVWEWNKGRDPTFWETIFYSGCHKTAWSLGVAWVIICCSIGQGGVVNYILTWKAWVPLGRLTYAAYLIHPLVQLTVVGALRMKLQPFHDFAVWMFFGHLMVTYGMAFALSMLIEAPCLGLEKIFLKKELLEDPPSNKAPMDGTAPDNDRAKKSVVNAEENLCSATQNYSEVCKL